MRSGRPVPAVVRREARLGERRVQRQAEHPPGLPAAALLRAESERRAAVLEACQGGSPAVPLGVPRRDGPRAAGQLPAVRRMARPVAQEQLTARRLAACQGERRTAEHLRPAAWHAAAGGPLAEQRSALAEHGPEESRQAAVAGPDAPEELPRVVVAQSDAPAEPQRAAVARSDAELLQAEAEAEQSGVPAAAVQAAEAARHEAPEPVAAAVLPDAERVAQVAQPVAGAEQRQGAAARLAVAAGRPGAVGRHAEVAWAVRRGRLRLAPAPSRTVLTARAIQSLPFASPTMRSSQAAGDEVWSCISVPSVISVRGRDEQLCVRPECGGVQMLVSIYFCRNVKRERVRSWLIQAYVSTAWMGRSGGT
jgi:peptidyl-tRNA hydrolase